MTDIDPDLAAEQADLWAQWYGFEDSEDLIEWGKQSNFRRLVERHPEKDPNE